MLAITLLIADYPQHSKGNLKIGYSDTIFADGFPKFLGLFKKMVCKILPIFIASCWWLVWNKWVQYFFEKTNIWILFSHFCDSYNWPVSLFFLILEIVVSGRIYPTGFCFETEVVGWKLWRYFSENTAPCLFQCFPRKILEKFRRMFLKPWE